METESWVVGGALSSEGTCVPGSLSALWLGRCGGSLVTLGPPVQPGSSVLSVLWVISVKLR